MFFKSSQDLCNSLSKAVPSKAHRCGGHSKYNCLQDQTNFDRSWAWKIDLIFNTDWCIVVISCGLITVFLSIFFRVDSLALGQSYDCPSACESALKNIGKHITWNQWALMILPQQNKTQQNSVLYSMGCTVILAYTPQKLHIQGPFFSEFLFHHFIHV